MYGTSCEGFHVAATQNLTPSMEFLCLTSPKQFLSGTVGTMHIGEVNGCGILGLFCGDITVVSLSDAKRGACSVSRGVQNPSGAEGHY